ncbi:hypothetical protein PTKIN_Ptkin02bG0152100 [Pterospermum kingtungense]
MNIKLRKRSYQLSCVYLQLCYVLYLAERKDLQKLIHLSICIYKFTNILELGDNGIFEVLSTYGDPHLGGDDFHKGTVKAIQRKRVFIETSVLEATNTEKKNSKKACCSSS